MIPYNIIKSQGVRENLFAGMAAGGRAWAAGAGRDRRQLGVPVPRAGLVPARGAGRGRGCADQDGDGDGCAGARVRGCVLCWVRVCGVRYPAGGGRWACGSFCGAVGGAWCSLRGDGVASVVVVVWCRVVYPRNKTCNAKTSYKCAILLLACKSLCGA